MPSLQAFFTQLIEGLLAAALPALEAQIEAQIEAAITKAISNVGTKHGVTITVPPAT